MRKYNLKKRVTSIVSFLAAILLVFTLANLNVYAEGAKLDGMQADSSDDATPAVVKEFLNHYVNAQEYATSYNKLFINVRYFEEGATTGGAVLCNVSNKDIEIPNVAVKGLADGIYKDQVSGREFLISDGKLSGKIEKQSLAVLYFERAESVSVYFTNNKGWSNVYAYYWGGANPSNAWPGNKMTKVSKNKYNQDVYTIEVPTDAKGLVFTNGSGKQTVDITSGIKENAAFAVGDSSGASYSVQTYTYGEEEPVTLITVYFTNNYSWDTVNAYYWGSTSSLMWWPGETMTYVKDNEFGQAVYSMNIPSDVKGIVFNAGAGEAQTADITSGIKNGAGFYITGGSEDAYEVGSYLFT